MTFAKSFIHESVDVLRRSRHRAHRGAVRGAVPPCGISSGPSLAATPVGVAAMTRRTLPEGGREGRRGR